ncbi:DUF4892 domain-containing protein [Congregibacter brevis]|uniref:DUF4892 domain-containing protein n=1 Tax=Congregibacter brevis TaxID=3081201 RepID=A0ABZ0II04_9GAMM|nr:DUF4892 domain-containing protein [Congregibacter sp. IMCC45268]
MRFLQTTVVLTALCGFSAQLLSADNDPFTDYFAGLSDYPHLEEIDAQSGERVRDYLVPLGAIEKIRGVWSPRRSDRVTGDRASYTWRVLDGYTSSEMVQELDERVASQEGVTQTFSCEARACGSSVQWANRIFQQRLLYGTEVSQRYRVYTLEQSGDSYRMLVYGSARSSDRQYLHVETIKLSP